MIINGIDMEAGLEGVNHDEEIYNEILQIYYEDGIAMLDVLKQNLQYTDLKLFVTHTHAMKSASKGIGANDVSERFREMEFAGRDEDMGTIEEKFPSCLAAFEKLLENIKIYLDGGSAGEESEASADVLKAMKNALADMDTDVFETMLEKLENSMAEVKLHGKVQEIRRAYEEYDFAQTLQLIEELTDNN